VAHASLAVKMVRRIVKRVLQLLALIACGVVVAAGVVTLGDYSQHHWTPDARWVSLGVFTTVTFAAVVAQFRRSWRRFTFWVALATLLALHIAGYVIVLRIVPEWRLPWFAAVAFVEPPVLDLVLDRAGFGPFPRAGGAAAGRIKST
jgi:hypothetical protein